MRNWETAILACATSSVRSRLDVIAGLVGDWHGAVLPDTPPPEIKPKTLQQFYSAVGGSLHTVCRQNRIVSPGELGIVDGKIEFALENQCVYHWAADLTDPDPPVFGRFEESDPWQPEGPVLSVFLLQFILFELMMGAPFGASASWLDQARLAPILREMSELPFPHWRWPSEPGRHFVRRNAVAFCSPNCTPDQPVESAPYSLWVGAKEPADVAFLQRHVGPDWEYVSLCAN